MDDIEMALEKLQGGPSIDEKVGTSTDGQTVVAETEVQIQNFDAFPEDVVDSGAVDHSSDSDYEPENEALVHAAAMSEKDMGKFAF